MQTNLHILVFFSFFCRGLGWGRDVYYHKSSLQYTCTNTSRVGFKERQPVFFFSRARKLNKVFSVNGFKFYNLSPSPGSKRRLFCWKKTNIFAGSQPFFPSGVGVRAHVTEFTCGLK